METPQAKLPAVQVRTAGVRLGAGNLRTMGTVRLTPDGGVGGDCRERRRGLGKIQAAALPHHPHNPPPNVADTQPYVLLACVLFGW